jgi:hypothetical protein
MGVIHALTLKMKSFIALLLALVSSSVLAQGPQQFELVYSFAFNGQYVGNVTDRFQREGSQYRLSSEARPEANLALLLPMLTLSSEGEMQAQHFIPHRYQQVRSNAPDKMTMAEFDWPHGVLTHQYKGKTQQTALPAGTLDALTQLYSFTLAGELPQQLEFPVSNGRKLITYRYEKQPAERMETPLGSFEAVEYRRVAEPGENAISVWIAPALHYLPLRIRVQEDSGTFEQQLIRLNYRPA